MRRAHCLLLVPLAFTPPLPAAAETNRIAVLPLSAMAVDASSCEKVRRDISETIARKFAVDTVAPAEVEQAVLQQCGEPQSWWDCLGQDEVLFDLSRTLQARWVLSGALAAMGDTQVFKFRLLDSARGSVSAEVVNIQAGDRGDLLPRFLLLVEHRFPAREAEPRQTVQPAQNTRPAEYAGQQNTRWYQHWWVWTAVGVAVAAAGGGLALWLTSSPSPEDRWDLRRTLP